jgi:hypothetical protein
MVEATPEPAANEPPVSPSPLVPSLVAGLGLLLAISAAFPLTPEGHSFVDLVVGEFRRGVLQGILMVTGFGSPFAFGLAVAAGILICPPPLARRIIAMPVALMHSQLILVAWAVWRHGEAAAALPLLGFSIVSAVYMAMHSAKASAEGDGPTFAWHVQWGATVIAAVAAWAKLQRVVGVRLEWGVDVMLLSALGLVLVLAKRPDAVR